MLLELCHACSYNYGDIALNCGTMVRECIKLPVLHEALLYGPVRVSVHLPWPRYTRAPSVMLLPFTLTCAVYCLCVLPIV